MSQLVITETMRAILVYMGSDPRKPERHSEIEAAMCLIPTAKVTEAIKRMIVDETAIDCRYGVILTAKGRKVAANIIELTRNRGK